MAALSSDHHCFSIESLELMEGYIGEMDLLYVVVHQHNLPELVQVHQVVEGLSQDLSMQVGNLSVADASSNP